MEVHAHAHPASGGTRKKWTHYFWEFLMLFLAVFCGFLAEYQLEHKIEKDREKAYIRSLVRDLEFDTAQFNLTISKIEKKVPYYDSVLAFLKEPAAFSNKLPFRYYIKTNLEKIYRPLSPTMQQLKSSGNLRLITKKTALDSIIIYDSKINGPYLNQLQYIVDFNKRIIELQESVFEGAGFNNYLNYLYYKKENPDVSSFDMELKSRDPEKIMQMANLYIDAKATDVFYSMILRETIEDAAQLIALIRRSYHVN